MHDKNEEKADTISALASLSMAGDNVDQGKYCNHSFRIGDSGQHPQQLLRIVLSNTRPNRWKSAAYMQYDTRV